MSARAAWAAGLGSLLALSAPARLAASVETSGDATQTTPRSTDQTPLEEAYETDEKRNVNQSGALRQGLNFGGARSQSGSTNRTLQDPALSNEQRELLTALETANRPDAVNPFQQSADPTQTPSLDQPPDLAARPAEVAALQPAWRVYQDNANDPTANMVIGSDHMWKGEHDKALPYFKTSLANGGDGPRTLTFAALSALNAGDPAAAAAWAAQALEQDPHGPLAKQAEAIEKLARKRLPKEEDPLERRGKPTDGGGTSVPELERPLPPRAAAPGLPPEAAAVLARVNQLVAQASNAYRTGDLKEAVRLAGEALAKDSDDVRALQVRAAAMAKAGRWEEARRDAERGLDLAPGYVPLLLLHAAAAARLKDWRAVKGDADAVLAKESANPTAWRFAGLAQAGLGDRAGALASLARAVQYGDREATRLLAAARSLPPGSDVVDLVEMLTGAAAAREAATDARAAPAPPAPRRSRTGLVVGAALLAGVVAGGLILLVGRRDEENA